MDGWVVGEWVGGWTVDDWADGWMDVNGWTMDELCGRMDRCMDG